MKKESLATREEMDIFVSRCIDKGWTVRYRNHPKTKANWLNPTKPTQPRDVRG